MSHAVKHLPSKKSFIFNLVMIFLMPFSVYLAIDATGISHFVLEHTRDVGRTFFHPTLFDQPSYSLLDHIKIFLYLCFHSGGAHIAFCASAHFIIQAGKDLHCLLFHKNQND